MTIEYPIIIECDLPSDVGGRYMEMDDIILINDINDTEVLIHEASHALWERRDAQLGKFLKSLRLSFNSDSRKAVRNKYLRACLDVEFIKSNYRPYDWFNEAVAYYMGTAPEKEIRNLRIHLFNDIMDEDFYYYNSDGEIFYKKTGNFLAQHANLKNILEDYRRRRLIL